MNSKQIEACIFDLEKNGYKAYPDGHGIIVEDPVLVVFGGGSSVETQRIRLDFVCDVKRFLRQRK